jgi:RimJ/RimL family protein N-acetyltransferase
VIRTERLELVPLEAELIEALVDGGDVPFAVPADWPDDHDARFLRMRLRQLGERPERRAWPVFAIVRDGEMVGHIGYHGPPGVNARNADGAVEVGYTVFPEHRRQGIAGEAVRGLLGWTREHGVERVIASVRPDNDPSLALVRRLGFVEVGRHWDDEDGEELEFELDLSGGGT